jgi:Icc-related predicted phosphoesterase
VAVVAAVGDVHAGLDSAGTLAPAFARLADDAHVLLLAGDLTRHGDPAEARVLARELAHVGVPVVATLGNHDHHSDLELEIGAVLADAGVIVLDGQAARVQLSDGTLLGVAGAKGFGGGFAGRCGTEFGEREMKAFIRHTREASARLHDALVSIDDLDVRIALLHYAPVPDTCEGEPREIFPFLGSYQLAEAIDAAGATLVLHGHAHHGSHNGTTPGGVPVRNVATHVIDSAYALFDLSGATPLAAATSRAGAAPTTAGA